MLFRKLFKILGGKFLPRQKCWSFKDCEDQKLCLFLAAVSEVFDDEIITRNRDNYKEYEINPEPNRTMSLQE